MKENDTILVVQDEDTGEVLSANSMSHAQVDWIRAGRLAKAAQQGDVKAAKQLEKMRNTQMVQIELEEEDYQ